MYVVSNSYEVFLFLPKTPQLTVVITPAELVFKNGGLLTN